MTPLSIRASNDAANSRMQSAAAYGVQVGSACFPEQLISVSSYHRAYPLFQLVDRSVQLFDGVLLLPNRLNEHPNQCGATGRA